MAPNRNTAWSVQENGASKDPDEWQTGDAPMTAPQEKFLRTLCEEAGEPFDPGLTKAQASKRIQQLRGRRP